MGKVDLHPDFKAFFESLNSAGVEYIVLGGYAVIHYGHHKSTDDIDVLIATTPENAAKVTSALQQFGGYPYENVKPSLFQLRNKVYIFGREPVRIDILTDASGLDFSACYRRRNMVDWDGVDIPLIHLDDLKHNKRLSGRPKDFDDLLGLGDQPT